MAISLNNHSAIDGEYPLLGSEPQPDAKLFPLYYQAKKIGCIVIPNRNHMDSIGRGERPFAPTNYDSQTVHQPYKNRMKLIGMTIL